MEIADSPSDQKTEIHKQAEKIVIKLVQTQKQLHEGIEAVKTREATEIEASLVLEESDLA